MHSLISPFLNAILFSGNARTVAILCGHSMFKLIKWSKHDLCKPYSIQNNTMMGVQFVIHEDLFRMMTSSNGNIFRATGPLCGEFTGPGEFPTQRPVTRSFDVYFDLRLNKRLSKQPWGWWFETLSWSLWRHRNGRLFIFVYGFGPIRYSQNAHSFYIASSMTELTLRCNIDYDIQTSKLIGHSEYSCNNLCLFTLISRI